MNSLIKLIILLLIFPLYSIEIIDYIVSFKKINVGNAVIKINKEYHDNALFHIESNVKSNKYLSYIYTLNDKVDIWVNYEDFSLVKVLKDIKEGSYKNLYQAEIIDAELVSQNISIKLTEPIYDPISLIYYLRDNELALNQSIKLTTFDMDIIREIKITLTNIEKINVPYGEFDCSVYKPSSIDESPLFRDDGLMTIWLSNDSLKLPIQIKQKTNFGTMTMKMADRTTN